MRIVTVILIAMISGICQAQEEKIKVYQYIQGRKLIVAQGFSAPPKKDDLYLFSKDGSQCELVVQDVLADDKAVLGASNCEFSEDIKVGSVLERSLVSKNMLKEEKPDDEETSQSPKEPVGAMNVGSPMPGRFGDLMYMPNRERFAVRLGFEQASGGYDLDFQGTNFSSNELSQTTLGLQLAYGLSDRMAIGFSTNQFIKDETETSFGPASVSDGEVESNNSEGLRDPIFGLRYRIVSQEEANYRFDIEMNLSPEIFDAEYPDENSQGNAGVGGSRYVVQLEAGKKAGRSEYAFSGTLAHITGLEKVSAADSSKERSTKARTNLAFGGNYRYIVNPSFDIRGGLSFRSFAESETQFADASKATEESYIETALDVAVTLYPVQDSVMIQLGYSSSAIAEHSLESGANSFDIEDGKSDTFRLLVMAQF